MRPYHVYGIRIAGFKKVYVGSTTNRKKRMRNHACLLMHGKHYNKALQKDFDSIPKESLKGSVEFLLLAGPFYEAIAIKKEQRMIDYFKKTVGVYNSRAAARHRLLRVCKEHGCEKRPSTFGWCRQHFRNAAKRLDPVVVERYGLCQTCKRGAAIECGECRSCHEKELRRRKREEIKAPPPQGVTPAMLLA